MRTTLLFILLPKLAVAIFVGALVIRFLRARRRIEVARAAARPLADLLGGRLTRAVLAVLVLAHLAGLLLPDAILFWNRAPARLYLLEGTGFALGLVALGGWARVTLRRMRDPDASAAEIGDCVFLSALFVALLSGLLTAVRFRWGSSWASGTLAPYLAGLFRGEPGIGFIEQMPALVQLHVLSLFAVVAAFPFTRVALGLVVGLDRALAVVTRPLAAGLRAARTALPKLRPRRWLWPEEEAEIDERTDG